MPAAQATKDVSTSSVHLDAARGLAALVVSFGHVRGLYFTSFTAPAPKLAAASSAAKAALSSAPMEATTIGLEAVMIFFVLSGYLVGGSVLRSAARGAFPWKVYLTKRLTRLWMVLIPALFLGFTLDHIGLTFFHQPGALYTGPPGQPLVGTNLAEALSARNFLGNLLFLQNIFVPTLGDNVALWSLAYEFWYYIAFPLLIVGLTRNSRPWIRAGALAAFVLLACILGSGPMLLFPIWVLGAGISLLPLGLNRRLAQRLAIALAAIFPIVFVLIRRVPINMYLQEWTIALLFGSLLYLFLHQTETAKEGPYKWTAGFFSRISYTLYLVHIPVAIFLCALIDRPWHRWPLTAVNLALFTTSMVPVIGFAYVFYLLFEANTDRVRHWLIHGNFQEKHLPTE